MRDSPYTETVDCWGEEEPRLSDGALTKRPPNPFGVDRLLREIEMVLDSHNRREMDKDDAAMILADASVMMGKLRDLAEPNAWALESLHCTIDDLRRTIAKKDRELAISLGQVRDVKAEIAALKETPTLVSLLQHDHPTGHLRWALEETRKASTSPAMIASIEQAFEAIPAPVEVSDEDALRAGALF